MKHELFGSPWPYGGQFLYRKRSWSRSGLASFTSCCHGDSEAEVGNRKCVLRSRDFNLNNNSEHDNAHKSSKKIGKY